MSMFSITIVVAAIAVPALFVLGAVLMTKGATPTERPAILLAFGWAFATVLRARGRREVTERRKVRGADLSLPSSDNSHVFEIPVPAQLIDTDGPPLPSAEATTKRKCLPADPEDSAP